MSRPITTAHFLLALVPWIAAFFLLRESRMFGTVAGIAMDFIAIALLALGLWIALWP